MNPYLCQEANLTPADEDRLVHLYALWAAKRSARLLADLIV